MLKQQESKWTNCSQPALSGEPAIPRQEAFGAHRNPKLTRAACLGLALCAIGSLWPAGQAKAQSPPSLAIQLTGSQQFNLTLNGAVGRSYRLETSSNLVNWVPLLTTNSITSSLMVSQSWASAPAAGFYRAVDLGPATGGSPNARFTLLWPPQAVAQGVNPLGLTPAGSVVFAVEASNGKTISRQVVNLSSATSQATVTFTGLSNGVFTVVADAFPLPSGTGVPFEEARFFFTVSGGSPVTQTFNLGTNTIANIILTPPNPTVAVGGTAQLNATLLDSSNEVLFAAAQSGELSWSSAGLPVATVDFTGKVTGVAPGTASISVADTLNPAVSTNITLTASLEIVGLTLSETSVVLPAGQETNLTVTATNASGSTVPLAPGPLEWTSSQSSSVLAEPAGSAGSGVVLGAAPGLAIVTVSEPLQNFGTPNPPGQIVPSATVTVSVTTGTGNGGGPGAAPPANGYTVIDLGTLPNTLSSLPVAINDYGHIAGNAWNTLDPTNPASGSEAFLWKTSVNNQMELLPDLGGGSAEATFINNNDQVEGWSIKAVSITSPKQYNHAVMWKSGKVSDLNKDLLAPTSPPWPPLTPPAVYGAPNESFGFRINNEGLVLGSADYQASTNSSEVGWASEFLLDLGQTNSTYLWGGLIGGTQFPPPPLPSLEAINDEGVMAGGLFLFNGVSASYAYAIVGTLAQVTSQQTTPLSNLPGYQSAMAYSINNLGQVAGLCSLVPTVVLPFTQPRAVLWQNGQTLDLGTNGFWSIASCINDVGTVVGTSWPSAAGFYGQFSQGRAVLWQGATMFDLNNFIPANSGWVLHIATGINNKSQIIGQGTRANELGYRSFLLIPNN